MFAFRRAVPEDRMLSSLKILDVLKELYAANVPMHALLIMKNDSLVFEKYYAPYDADTLHRMFSITKSFTAIAIALLMEEGKVDPDRSICDYFPESVDESTHPWILATTVRDMLMMRTCHASTTYKVDMKSDWVESFFTVSPTHKPGTVFHYDTSAAHVLCALAEKITRMDVLDYLKEKILHHVSFSQNSYMVKDPFGVSIGGSGLMATPMDVLKVLYILHHKGTITCADGQERTLISPEFIDMATSNLSDTLITAPVPSEAQGYGMQIWQNEQGGFVLYGMGGQLAISLPEQDMLIVTCADTQGMQGGNQLIYNALYKNLCSPANNDPSTNDPAAHESLCRYADTLRIAPPRLPASYDMTGTYTCRRDIPDFIMNLSQSSADLGNASSNDKVYGKTSCGKAGITLNYRLADNPQGFEGLTLDLSDPAHCTLILTQKENLHTIDFGIQSMCEGLFPIYKTPYTAGALWLRDNVLYVRVHLIGESVGSVHFQFYFEPNDITVFMRKIEETYFQEFDGHLYGIYAP